MSTNCGVVYVKPGVVRFGTLPLQNLKIPMATRSTTR